MFRAAPLWMSLLLYGCATSCPSSTVCGAATWLHPSGLTYDGMSVVSTAVFQGVSGESGASDRLPVRSTPSVVRFDLRGMDKFSGIERAVLLLTPHPSWRTQQGRVQLSVELVGSSWTAETLEEYGTPTSAYGGQGTSVVDLPAGLRTPVRIEVTGMIRAWRAGLVSETSLALRANREGLVFAGAGASVDERPRLELVVR